jgi:hypothetical protein
MCCHVALRGGEYPGGLASFSSLFNPCCDILYVELCDKVWHEVHSSSLVSIIRFSLFFGAFLLLLNSACSGISVFCLSFISRAILILLHSVISGLSILRLSFISWAILILLHSICSGISIFHLSFILWAILILLHSVCSGISIFCLSFISWAILILLHSVSSGISIFHLSFISWDILWAYTYTAENPAEHPGGTCRPSGPQGLDVRHRALVRSQPRTASANAGEAIRTLFGQRLRPDPLLRGRTYVRTYLRASRGYSYVHGIEVTVCTGDSCYAEVGFNTIMYYVLQSQPSEKTNALLLRDKQELHRTTDTGQYSVLRRLRKICKRTRSRLAPK